MTPTPPGFGTWRHAAPFGCAFLLVPLLWLAALRGGWTIALVPMATWYLFAILDAATGPTLNNADPQTPDADLRLYRALTLAWAPVQFVTLFGLIWYVTQASDLRPGEQIGVFFGMGVLSGTVGINYSHELMHQRPRIERRMADGLLAMVLYSHFRSEHLLVHHRYVATPRDPVTARYGESFYRFFPRVLVQCPVSAFRAEAAMLARRGRGWHDPANPFVTYAALQAGTLALAFALGGWAGLGLFVVQALVAVWQLELVNYVEHYGLARRQLPDGRFEPVRPHHSWNAAQRATNWLLINLQRHSDHHYKPDRRFPLLQHHDAADAPQLPFGYPVMTVAAMIPPLWRRIMHPRVKAWRKQHYPDITRWA
ncbi:MAG: alkane 1-monooxygenase [Marinibacterium sp.]|nr:alkane 1-monooxygenase [Marinibacterium sp.]